MDLNPIDLRTKVKDALACSIAWRGYTKHPNSANSYKSAYFCHKVGEKLHTIIKDACHPVAPVRRQITFDKDEAKVPGEWLLDIVWTEDFKPDDNSKCAVPKKIWCAVECESNTSAAALFIDLAKLVCVQSPIKIFLAGMDQTTDKGAGEYRCMRTEQIERYIGNSHPDA